MYVCFGQICTLVKYSVLMFSFPVSVSKGKTICLGKSDTKPFRIETEGVNRSCEESQHVWCIKNVQGDDSGLYELATGEKVYRTKLKVITSGKQLNTLHSIFHFIGLILPNIIHQKRNGLFIY